MQWDWGIPAGRLWPKAFTKPAREGKVQSWSGGWGVIPLLQHLLYRAPSYQRLVQMVQHDNSKSWQHWGRSLLCQLSIFLPMEFVDFLNVLQPQQLTRQGEARFAFIQKQDGLQEWFDPAPSIPSVKNQSVLSLLRSSPSLFPKLCQCFHFQVFAHTWLACSTPPNRLLPCHFSAQMSCPWGAQQQSPWKEG